MRCVGGPFDGEDVDSTADQIEITDTDGRYVRWYDVPDHDPDWWMHGLPEPQKPERYYLWRLPGESLDNPGVAHIRAAMDEAMEGMA